MYLPLGAFFRGYRVILDDSALAFDYPTPLASEFRRKVRTLAGVYQIVGSYPALLGPRQSHVDPFCFAQTRPPRDALGDDPRRRRFLWPVRTLEILGHRRCRPLAYLLALSDSWMPANFPLKRLTSPLRTFAVLMPASLCSLAILFVPASVLWKETRVSGAHGKHHSHGAGIGQGIGFAPCSRLLNASPAST